jgi:hypothetical protein
MVTFSSPQGRATFHFTARGKLYPAVADAHVAVDTDGTLDDASDDDEEW